MIGPAELRERRQMLHLTQVQLGRVLGVSPNTVARWERGNLSIRHGDLVAMALDRLAREDDHADQTRDASMPSKHNLPAELGSFVGREHQLVDLLRQLRTVRLLTLTGPGGVGKTRLGLQLARAARPHLDGGAWFADLAPVADDSLIGATVANTLHVRERPGEPILNTVAAAIGQRQLLLVLDNCEHLVQSCAELTDGLLRACPHLTILATSRQALHIPGETTWMVPPLGLPDSASTTVGTVRGSEAVQLFLERARAVAPDFALTTDNWGLVARVCAQLDGLPLALELAAARLNVLDLDQLAARLDDRLGLLVRGPRTAHARQQTLRATLDWSYGLLDESERRLFNRVAVFAGDWDLETTEAVCAEDGIEVAQVLDLLTCLVDQSLVAVSSAEPRRYRLLETVRAYASQRLEASGEAERVRMRHAAIMAGLAKRLGTVVSAAGPEAKAALDHLRQEWDNLRAALRWVIDSQSTDLALRLAGALAEIWFRLGFLSEGSYWLAQVLGLPHSAAPSFERAWALNGAGWLAVRQGQYTTARVLNDESLAIGRALHDALLVSRGLITVGVGELEHGGYSTARDSFEEALVIARGNDDAMGEGMALFNLSLLAVETGDCTSAEKYAGEALACGQMRRSTWIVCLAVTQLGQAALGQGDPAKARGLLEENLLVARASGDRALIARTLDGLGNVALAQGHHKQAAALLRESLQLLHDLGFWPDIPRCLESLARTCAANNEPERAMRLVGAAAALRQTLDLPHTPRERIDFERWLPAVRRHLGKTLFEAACEAGQVTPLDPVIADALSSAAEGVAATLSNRSGARPTRDLLTAREREVALLVARGLTNGQLADELVITRRTAENHLRHIFDKLGVNSRAQVAAWVVGHDTTRVAQRA
jgi:predicted ATPase/DNA-binding CsgD family transcriptional regulator